MRGCVNELQDFITKTCGRSEIPSVRSGRQLVDRARRGAWRQQEGQMRAWEGRVRRSTSRSSTAAAALSRP